jgi:hypothetical protein
LKRALLPEHDGLLIFMLKQRDPARFNRKMIEMQVIGNANNPVAVAHSISDQPRARVVILPDNNREAMSPEQIQAERQAVEREYLIGSGVLIEAEAEPEPETENE